MVFKRIFGIGLCFLSFCAGRAEENVISFTIGGKQTHRTNQELGPKTVAKMPLFIGLLDMYDADMTATVSLLKNHLEASAQFDIACVSHEFPKTKGAITALFDQGFMLAFFLNSSVDAAGLTFFEWRLYDTMQAELIKGKKVLKTGVDIELCARMLACDMWKELMGDEGPFLTKICYVKKALNVSCNRATQVCTCSSDGFDEHVLFASPSIVIAPVWGHFLKNPFLTYSEFTRSNVRLMSFNLKNRRKRPIIDLDGTTAGVSSIVQSDDMIYGRSGGIWRYHYDAENKKGLHRLLIKENGVCASPILLSDDDIIYCSQGKIKRYRATTGTREILVGEGYSVGPAFNEKTGGLVYSHRIKGSMQLFLFNFVTGHKEQLTFDKGDKTDACWSPCGQWIAFCTEQKGKSRIMTLHVKTGASYVVTSAGSNCCYPNWSDVRPGLFE